MRWLRNGLALFCIALGMLVLLPFGLLFTSVETRRIRAAARRSACAGCGKTLGEEAARLADKARQHYSEVSRLNAMKAFVEQLQKEGTAGIPSPDRASPSLPANHPLAFDIVALHAICAHCGQHHAFIDKIQTFTPVSWTPPTPVTW